MNGGLRPRPAISTLAEALRLRARDSPEGFAYAIRGERVTWQSLLGGVLTTASALQRRGVGPGSRCALVLPTSVDFVRGFYAALLLGAVPVAMNPRQRLPIVRRRCDELECTLAVIRPPAGDDLEALRGMPWATPADLEASASGLPSLRHTPAPDDLSHLQLTSGTSGAPRAAMILQRNVLASLTATHDLLQPTTDDVLVGWLPLHHDLGLMRFLFFPLYAGCGCHLIEPSMAALPVWLETITRVSGTITAAPDFAYRLATRLVDPARVQLRSLRAATNGGEAVRLTSIRSFEQRFGVPGVVLPGYGLAEATLGVSSVRPGEALTIDASGHVACGRPQLGVTVAIVDESNVRLAAGVRGRIVVSGPTVFAGYWQDPEQTAEVIKDGWLDTGDEGALDAEGRLFVLGRSRAMIKRAGVTIAPREVEEAADEVAGVRRSAAIGMAVGDGDLTEDVVVIVEVDRRRDTGDAALQAAVADRIRAAIGVAPRDVVLVSPGTIPRTPTGKTRYLRVEAPGLSRRSLRRRRVSRGNRCAGRGAAAAASTATNPRVTPGHAIHTTRPRPPRPRARRTDGDPRQAAAVRQRRRRSSRIGPIGAPSARGRRRSAGRVKTARAQR